MSSTFLLTTMRPSNDHSLPNNESTALLISLVVFCTSACVFTTMFSGGGRSTYHHHSSFHSRQQQKQQQHNSENRRSYDCSSSSTSDSSITSFQADGGETQTSLDGNDEPHDDDDEDEIEDRQRRRRRIQHVPSSSSATAPRCSLQEYMTQCYALRQIFSRASFDSREGLFDSTTTTDGTNSTTRRSLASFGTGAAYASRSPHNRSYRHYDQSDSFLTTVSSDIVGSSGGTRRTSTVAEESDDDDRGGGIITPPGLDNSNRTTTEIEEHDDLRATLRINNHSGNDNHNHSSSHGNGSGGRSLGPSPSASFLEEQLLNHDNDGNIDNSALSTTNDYPSFLNHAASQPVSFHETRNQRLLARQIYNASILPNKVIMVRHGQSAGNTNEELFSQMPDHSIPLTELGWEQAKMAGKALKESIITKGETVHFIVSPYVRTMETFHGIVSAWCDPSSDEFRNISDVEERKRIWYDTLHNKCGITWHEDPRIREQDFGNYQDVDIMKESKLERQRFGHFYYRFQNGESGTDVFDRVSTFLDSLWRSFDTCRYQNCVLVTHGISIRVLLSRYFRYSVDQFHELANPKNCEMVILHHDGSGMLRLQGRCQLQTKTIEETNEEGSEGGEFKTKVTGYELHSALRVYPKKYTKNTTRKIRISFDG